MKVLKSKKPEKNLVVALHKRGGRNSFGRITIRHRGGGARKIYRKVNFGQEYAGIEGTVLGFEHDPNRSAFLALVEYANGEKGYVLAAEGMEVGGKILCAEKTELVPGNRMKFVNIPVGTLVHNIELEHDKGGRMVRSAGGVAKVIAKDAGMAHLEMPSSEVRKVSEECYASVGTVSHSSHMYERIPNAGRARKMGLRPEVRGSAMNPVDHPHGGGEGRSPIGMKYPKTPWGKHALGVKTRNKKKWTSKLIVSRRKKRKKK